MMNAMYVHVIFSLVLAFLVTGYLIPLIRHVAEKIGFLDIPDGKIKKHGQAIPYLGGVAVYLGFLLSLIVTLSSTNPIVLLLPGLTLLLFVGLFDDAVTCKPYQKFFGQFIAALCFIKAGFYLKEHIFYHFWTIPCSLLWLLTIINAFNLVDVMDGLSSLISLGAAGSFLLLAVFFSQWHLACALGSFIGAVAVFFIYNRPPASIYFGDAGALFIGGFLAVIPFMLPWGTYTSYGYLAPLVILALPLLELVTLIIVRSYKKIPFYRGSPDHFSHYLLRNGWSKNGILGYIAGLSAVLGLVSNLFVRGHLGLSGLLLAGGIFLSVWFIVLLLKKR